MNVELRETMIEIPTNRLQSPSVNPALFGKNFHPFPYTMQNHTEDALTPVAWRAIKIENKYLKLVVLPDMGGHIAELYDKLAGRDIFTPIKVIKPRMIAHRGAWAAGGMEFNFPISHSPTTLDSVNCLTRSYPDGSASVVFGAIERLSFMNWKVELRLYPEMAYLEESVELMNPTDNFHRFYWWNNAAVPYVRGMRMAYPFDWRTTLDRGYEKWPMDGLFDSSDPATVPDAYETFGKLMMRDFFGVHYPEWDFGVAHSAARKHVKGAKFFMWGNDELAHAWNRALLNDGEEYIEIQSGVYESQTVFKHLKPHGLISWKEYWYGVRGIGLYNQATRDVAMAMERTSGGVVLRFSANGRYDDAVVKLSHCGQKQESRVSLAPETPVTVEFSGIDPEEKLAVDVFCHGRLLLSFGHGAQPSEDAPDTDLFDDCRVFHPAKEYDDRPLMQGLQHEQWGRLGEAVEAYKKNLSMNPQCTVTLDRLGRIMLTQRRAAEAINCFEQALRIDNRDGTARFGLAAALNLAGDTESARRLYYDIASDDPMFEASALEAAALNIRLGDPYDNLTLLENTANPYGKFLLAVSCRLCGLLVESSEEPDALEEYFFAEWFLSTGDGAGLSAFTLNHEEQLVCIALEYARLGLLEDCNSIISLALEPTIKSALVKALCGRISLEDALGLPVCGVFVNEPLLLNLLESSCDSTGKAAWLLGCFQYSVGLKAEALERWLTAWMQGFRHTALLFSLGQAFYLNGDFEEASRFLREDMALHGSANAESLALLYRVLKERGDIARMELLPLLVEAANRPMVIQEIVESLRDGGQLDEALEVLETAHFQNWEGDETAGFLWSSVVGALALKHAREGQVDTARALVKRMFDYPAGLNYGHKTKQSQAEYWHMLGQIYRLTGDQRESREAFRKGALEGGTPEIRNNEQAMRWIRLCQDELRV